MSSRQQRIAIAVVSWNTRELLSRCLASIWPPDSATVFVVDNASSDGSAEMVRATFPWVHLLQNAHNVGFAAANNQAYRAALESAPGFRYLLLLNSDAELQPRAIDHLIAFMDEHTAAGAAGARLLNPDGTLQRSCHPMLTPWRELWRLSFLDRLVPRATYPMSRWDPAAPRRVEVIKGACLMLRREAIDREGLFDERYFMYTEEVDLCYRLAQAGWELWWAPQAEVVHHEAQSSRQNVEKMYIQLYRSKVLFYRKVGGEALANQFKLYLRLAYWPRLAAASLSGLLSPTLAARARTFRSLLAKLPGM